MATGPNPGPSKDLAMTRLARFRIAATRFVGRSARFVVAGAVLVVTAAILAWGVSASVVDSVAVIVPGLLLLAAGIVAQGFPRAPQPVAVRAARDRSARGRRE
ncbi:hypothetical protein PSAL_000070 [Pseudooceanicola algae]|uniref:Uncharacterized protein n=2 Tax=Pseudooceanicola algae TaxID=1537215 RepID=A0A418SJU6_9RHOB|nr:hypothetical protein PSAL_000070 [Pseudooceanicola algae]